MRRWYLAERVDVRMCAQGAPGLNGAWEVIKRINQRRIADNLRGAEANIWRQHDQEGTTITK